VIDRRNRHVIVRKREGTPALHQHGYEIGRVLLNTPDGGQEIEPHRKSNLRCVGQSPADLDTNVRNLQKGLRVRARRQLGGPSSDAHVWGEHAKEGVKKNTSGYVAERAEVTKKGSVRKEVVRGNQEGTHRSTKECRPAIRGGLPSFGRL